MEGKRMPVACELAPLCFALAVGLLINIGVHRQLAAWLAYVLVLAALRAQERAWGLECHLPRCRPTTAAVVGSVLFVQAGWRHAAASAATVLFIIPDRWLWFARAGVRGKAPKVKKRPAQLATPRDITVGEIRALRKWQQQHRGRMPKQGAKQAVEKRLATWVNNARKAYMQNRLTKASVCKLESLPGWRFKARDWQHGLQCLRQWLAQHPGKFPSQGAKQKTELKVARWCNYQRTLYAKGELPGERAAELESLTRWSWTAQHWWLQLRGLQDWAVANPTALLSRTADDKVEGCWARWCSNQRALHKKGQLSDEQVRLLAKFIYPVQKGVRVWGAASMAHPRNSAAFLLRLWAVRHKQHILWHMMEAVLSKGSDPHMGPFQFPAQVPIVHTSGPIEFEFLMLSLCIIFSVK
jgi:hypothetical protein